ncbi:hypothetical protein Taro_025101 [Colocasia esculenta]|uniref:Uncharacterized protein n=1 Tax=Colocasia esculenta TaxID=4460 RepID=A0A843V8J7_COLES|nr:hypothetical protein [Colocasia esculenta]
MGVGLRLPASVASSGANHPLLFVILILRLVRFGGLGETMMRMRIIVPMDYESPISSWHIAG